MCFLFMKWHNSGGLTLLASAFLWTSHLVHSFPCGVSGLPHVLQTLLHLDVSCSFCCFMLVQWLYPGLWPAQFETLVSDCQPAISTWMYFSKLSSEYPIELSFPHSIFVLLNRGAAHSCKSSIWESCLVFLTYNHIQLITNSCKLLRPSFSSFFSWVGSSLPSTAITSQPVSNCLSPAFKSSSTLSPWTPECSQMDFRSL